MDVLEIDAADLADLDAVTSEAMQVWRLPPPVSLSEWAETNFVLSSETSAEPGRWHTLPYQRGIMSAITDRSVVRVTLMKSARIGYTLMVSAAIGYHIDYDPASMLVVQPTDDDTRGFSKETIAPMLRDVPCLARIMVRDTEAKGKRRGTKDASDTLTHKEFPGGILSIAGAHSASGLRRISRKIILLDEVDGYPPSAGSEGDPVKLAERRSAAFWDRKIIAGSTPTIAGSSRIESMFEAGDQRRFYVPCPHCGHFDYLRLSQRRGSADADEDDENGGESDGHTMQWDDGQPETACFMCSKCGCAIEESHKHDMIEAGEWRAAAPGNGTAQGRVHASFHIWTAYSPFTRWAEIVAEFLEAKRLGVEALKTFIMTWLGETWQELGEAPEWERLYERREHYAIGAVNERVVALTCGVDVQKDRLVYEVVGWAPNLENWSVDAGELHGDTANEATWLQLDELLDRDFASYQIRMMAVDSGWNTQAVYNWVRRHRASGRVMAVKGAKESTAPLLGAPSPVEINYGGKRIQRGLKLWPVGGHAAKSELYGWLHLRVSEGDDPPRGFCHFPQYGEQFFEQLTAEHLVTRRRAGRTVRQWEEIPNRENHHLDCRVYARAAAARIKIENWKPSKSGGAAQPAALATTQPAPAVVPAPASPPAAAPPRQSGIFGAGAGIWGGGRRGIW
jgi:phage terminase large subunit GpA-like protein